MKLFNTLTNQIEEVSPQNPPEVKVYTCGPTVYDYMHIGNWFTFIRYDLLIRTLKASGFDPKWVINITDVGHLTSDADTGEDKLAKRAKSEGKTAWEIASFYTDYFKQGLVRLNFTQPWQMPKATDHIQGQINFILGLEKKGYTYRTSDGIYYDTSKFPNYASFAKLDLDEQQPGARIEPNPEKHNPSDFALWKFSPSNVQRDMEWDSPWGKGFPGWHIECSAMCLRYLGETLDIHSGGIDHIPIHHTNEIAQSEALTGKPLAKIWMHTNHILINGTKISKSLGNTVTLEDIEAKGYTPETLRMLVLESHYRSQSKFDWNSLAASEARLLRYRNFAARMFQAEPGGQEISPPDLLTVLQDDLNSPACLAVLENWLDKAEVLSLSKKSIVGTINSIDNLLGLKLSEVLDIPEELKQLIVQREQARNKQDWTKADQLRAELNQHGITVLDRPSGPLWQYLA
jgi:cysteinyl-tRNA synthetase